MTTRKPVMPEPPDPDLLAALRLLDRHVEVPPPDAAREAALLAAFDAARARRARAVRVSYWLMGGLTTAAALLIATGLVFPGAGRRTLPPGSSPRTHTSLDSRGVRSQVDTVGDFVSWPGSSSLPPLESGQLLRVNLPVSMLPSLGLIPPASQTSRVRADVLVGQDGLARAVRLVD